MPPLRSLLPQQPPSLPAGPARPQGPLSVADKLMTLAQGLLGVNEPQPGEFQTPEDFQQAGKYYMGGTLASMLAPILAATTLKAYHGSPHDFEQFSSAKIGTGEGAQAYGHGLYFAEKEGTARQYRNQVTAQLKNQEPTEIPQIRGLIKSGASVDDARSHVLNGLQDQLEAAKFNLRSAQLGGPRQSRNAINPLEVGKQERELVEHLQRRITDVKAWPTDSLMRDPGRMYEVNLHTSPDELLDWDKPLSQQSPKVQEALKKAGVKWGTLPVEGEADPDWGEFANLKHEPFHYDPTGGELIRGNTSFMGVNVQGGAHLPNAEQKLKDAGIKGIQYLDQGSRAAGEGTRNFVIFDDKIIEIAKKYGIPLATAASLYKWQQSQKGVE